MRNKILNCILLLLLITQPICAAKDDSPPPKTTVKTLAVFKNGLGFVYRSGEVPVKDYWAQIDEIPPAVLGTLWIGSVGPVWRVQEVVSDKCTSEKSVDAASISDLLEANVGRQALLTFLTHSTPETKTIPATILSVPKDGQIVMIQMEDGTIGVTNKSDVIAVTLDKDAPLKKKSDITSNCAKVRLSSSTKKAPASAEITLAYLEKGISWSPGYLVNIADDKQADIIMEAVLANDMEDLNDVDVSFVVGYPNFVFADQVTPLWLGQSVVDFSRRLSSMRSDDARANVYGNIMSQSVMYNTASYDFVGSPNSSFPSVYSAAQPMPGETNEDLYFYNQSHVSLKKGDRARYTVFTGKVPYEHIYEWSVPDESNLNDYGYRQNDNRNDSPENQVWHSLRLTNTTKFPWTTAPSFTVNGSMPVAQDVLKYTPPGGKNTLKLTVATNVRAEKAETEASREMVKIGYHEYDDIKVDGTLTVKNMKDETIQVNIKKELKGVVLEAGQDGKVTKTATKLAAVNPQSVLEWEFDLAPGAEKELTYKYKILVCR